MKYLRVSAVMFLMLGLISNNSFASCKLVTGTEQTLGYATSEGSFAITVNDKFVTYGSKNGVIIQRVMKHIADEPSDTTSEKSYTWAICSLRGASKDDICYGFYTSAAANLALEALRKAGVCGPDSPKGNS